MNISFTQGHHGPAQGGAAAGGDVGEVPRDGCPRPLHDGLDAVGEAVGRLAAPVDVLEGGGRAGRDGGEAGGAGGGQRPAGGAARGEGPDHRGEPESH